MINSSRGFVALISLDEECTQDTAPGEHLEREFGWLEQSGLFLDDWMIVDDDEDQRWARYTNYLIQWAFDHRDESFEGNSPAAYNEWCDVEDDDNQDS